MWRHSPWSLRIAVLAPDRIDPCSNRMRDTTNIRFIFIETWGDFA